MIDFYKYSDYFDYYKKWSFRIYCIECLRLINFDVMSSYIDRLRELKNWSSLSRLYDKTDFTSFNISSSIVNIDKTIINIKIINLRKECLYKCHLFSRYEFFKKTLSSYTEDDLKVFEFIDKKSAECPRLFRFLAKKIKSRSKTISCIRKRLNNIVSRDTNSYFVTFTFSDLCFAKLDKVTRRRYISRICKQFSSSYVANLDYGGQFHREHYHALMNCSDINELKRVYHEYFYDSIINIKKVTNSPKSLTNLCAYTNKLVLHCVKSSADRIIYSR